MLYLLQIFDIISHLPKVSFLNLSDNPLWQSDPIGGRDMVQCCNICQLVLNATRVSWETIVQLLTLFSG